MSLLTSEERDEARRQAWLEERRRYVTSTDAAIIFGCGYEGSSPVKLWGQKKGLVPPDPETERMELGLLLEPAILTMYQRKTGLTAVKADPFTLHKTEAYPWLAASGDGLDSEGRRLELKYTGRFISSNEDIPLTWQIQMQVQTVVFDVDGIRLVTLQPGEVKYFDVPRNEAFIETKLIPKTKAFHELLQGDVPPRAEYPEDNDGFGLVYRDIYSADLVRDLDETDMRELLERRALLKEQQKELEANLDLTEARIKEIMGEADTGIFQDEPDVRVTWRKTARGHRQLRVKGL